MVDPLTSICHRLIHGRTRRSARWAPGPYEHATEVGARVLARLPSDLVLRGLDSPLIALLASEVSHDPPGQVAVPDRLLDVLVVTSLREVFSTSTDVAPRWYAAMDDPVVGRGIQLMHHHPAHPWSVASLAAACGVSRATLARRFTDLVGEPPTVFLTGWRLALAADLLADSTSTIGSVATRVGHGNAFALSAAFKRVYGIPPADYRLQALERPNARVTNLDERVTATRCQRSSSGRRD